MPPHSLLGGLGVAHLLRDVARRRNRRLLLLSQLAGQSAGGAAGAGRARQAGAWAEEPACLRAELAGQRCAARGSSGSTRAQEDRAAAAAVAAVSALWEQAGCCVVRRAVQARPLRCWSGGGPQARPRRRAMHPLGPLGPSRETASPRNPPGRKEREGPPLAPRHSAAQRSTARRRARLRRT